MRWSRIVPVVVLGLLAVGYLLLRDSLMGRIAHLGILEFPVAVLVFGILLYLALRPAAKPVPPPEWRRHEQIVRQMPDPAATSLASIVERYIETGEAPDEAARVLAPESHEGLAATLSTITSRRKRRSEVEHLVHDPGA